MQNGGLEKLKKIFSEVYLIEDPYIIEVIVASVITQFLSSDPAWLVIVAPSGGCKSELINSICLIEWTPPGENKATQKVHAMSTLTAKTFVSGQKTTGKETSLLMQISNGIITFKDLTSLLSEHKDDRSVIMAQLREIYDGRYSKSFGTGETINWKGKITIVAGATYAIHAMKQAYSAMGERFVFYNMIQPERIDAGRRSMENQEEGKMKENRQMLAEAMRDYIIEILDNMPVKLPKLKKGLQDDLLALAELATRARSDVERNWRSPQMEVTEVHPPEMPTRFAGQLQAFVRAFMVINHHETEEMTLAKRHPKILIKLALDSVTRSRRTAMQELAKYEVLETAGLATKLGLPTVSVRRWIEDLTALEIADREKGAGPKGDRWKIKKHYRELMKKFEGIEMEKQKELTEENVEPMDQGIDDIEAQQEMEGLNL